MRQHVSPLESRYGKQVVLCDTHLNKRNAEVSALANSLLLYTLDLIENDCSCSSINYNIKNIVSSQPGAV
jgi:hypothetical protein